MVTQMDWGKLVEERNVWVDHNFPGDLDGSGSIFGIIEELGELTHHHLKEKQAIRGTAEHHQAEAQDAVGDYVIYALGIMDRWSFVPELHEYMGRAPGADFPLLMVAHHTGRVVEGYIANVPARMALQECVQRLYQYTRSREWDFEQIVHSTWEKVSQRDWVRFPHNGVDQ